MKMNFQIKRSKGSGQNYYTTSGPTVMNEGDSFCLYPPPLSRDPCFPLQPLYLERPMVSSIAPLPLKWRLMVSLTAPPSP